MTVLSITQSQIDKGLLFSNFYWSGSTVTYSIPNGGTSWAPGYEEAANASYSEFTAAQAAQFVSAIELWDSYIATSLVQVDDGATYGDIRVAYANLNPNPSPNPEENIWGYANIPPYLGSSAWPESGDIWVDAANKGSLYTVGSYDYMALLHEIGHALGLKHSFVAPAIPKELDSSAYTLMSYNSSFEWRITFDMFGYSYSRVDDATPMVLDVAAIQSRYGADMATAAGATIYKITDAMTLSRRAIYDAGGTDTIDLSGLSRGSHLDLRPGAYSDLAYYAKADQIAAAKAAFPGMSSVFIESAFDDTTYEWTNNFGIAYSTVIENAVGSRFTDTIRGNDVSNIIDGGLGNDILTGGGGQDIFRGSSASLDGTTITDLTAGDTIVITDAGATITGIKRSGIFVTVSFKTASNTTIREVDILALGEFGPLLFEGGTVSVGGGAAADTFTGRAGNDIYSGGEGVDTVLYGATKKALTVNLGLTTAQNVGVDFGYDKLLSIENLVGGAAADQLTGSAAANMIRGGGGDDVVAGLGGIDTLYGETGNDTLDGGAGADLLYGGAGNDIYVVDDAGDVVREDTVSGINDGGIDLVRASAGVTLGTFVENLTLTGRNAIDGNGNALANVITGNSAANRLSGFDGADRLDGGAGDDTLRGGAGRDILIGGSGRDDLDGGEDGDTYYVDATDTVMDSGTTGIDLVISNASFTLKTGSGIENLSSATTALAANLSGNELDNAITGYGAQNVISGMAGVDTIRAGAGNDTLRGGFGADKLYGEAGADVFIFRTGESLATAGRDGADTIYDFATGEDRIDLTIYAGSAPAASYSEIAVSSDNLTVLKKAAEAAMTGGVKTVFVAGQTNGWLFWSSNGLDGTAEEAIRLGGCNTLAGFDRMDLI